MKIASGSLLKPLLLCCLSECVRLDMEPPTNDAVVHQLTECPRELVESAPGAPPRRGARQARPRPVTVRRTGRARGTRSTGYASGDFQSGRTGCTACSRP